VEKGETLTPIAKHYNIPLSDLQRLNKITNDRKLQIGQTLVVPTPPKAPETPVEKKETP
jgi:LysM repeat protein